MQGEAEQSDYRFKKIKEGINSKGSKELPLLLYPVAVFPPEKLPPVLENVVEIEHFLAFA